MAVEHDEAAAAAPPTASRKKRAASRPVSTGGEATVSQRSSSRVRGAHPRRPGKHAAQTRDPGQQPIKWWLGTFDTAEEAARAYDAAAIRLHGAAATTNYEHPAAAVTANCRPKSRSGTGLLGVQGTRSGRYGAQIWFRTADEAATMHAAATDLNQRADDGDAPLPHVSCSRGGKDEGDAAEAALVAAFADLNRHADDGDAPLRHRRVSRKGKDEGAAEKIKKKRATGRSGFRGVYRHPRSRGVIYSAQIRDPERRGKLWWLGSFATAEEAARAYDTAAVRMYGAEAMTNFEQPPTAAAAAIGGEEPPVDLSGFPELQSDVEVWRREVAALGTRSAYFSAHPYRGQTWDSAQTANLCFGSFGSAEETAMDLNDFLELPELNFFPDSITTDAQLDDLLSGLPPLVELQQVDELLKDMGFIDMVS